MRKTAVMIGFLALLFMVGCGSQSSDTGSTDTGQQSAAESESSDSGSGSQGGASPEKVAYDEAKAKGIYQQSCVGCHGQNLEGGVGPALKGNNLDEKQILEVLENGKGQMPAGLVSGEDAKNLAAWLADQ